MADHLSVKKRSWNMGRIRSKHTTPEIKVRSLLHSMGYRFRLHSKDLPGKPDIVMPRHKIVVFCHGCFWHQHPKCKRASTPKSNIDYWKPKLQGNVLRFEENKKKMQDLGWKVVVIWECETKSGEKLRKIIRDRIS